MQLFSATILKKNIFAPENMKKPPSKVAHNRPLFFYPYCQVAQNQPKSNFLFHKNVSQRDFYIMTLADLYSKWKESKTKIKLNYLQVGIANSTCADMCKRKRKACMHAPRLRNCRDGGNTIHLGGVGPPHSWAKVQKPAKNVIQNFVKLTGHTYACNSLTNF